MKKIMMAVMIIILGAKAGNALSEDYAAYFARGNSAYQNKDYKHAIENYEKLVKQNYVWGDVFFNLGNAHYSLAMDLESKNKEEQTVHLGLALLNYEKAYRYISGDEDLKHNAALVRKDLGVSLNKGTWLRQFYLTVLEWWPWRYWLMIVFALEVVVVSGSILRVFGVRRAVLDWLVIISAMILLCLAPLVGYHAWERFGQKSVILIDGQAIELRNGPSNEFDAVYKVAVGSKGTLLSRQGVWGEILLDSNIKGWVPLDMCQLI